MLPDSFPITSKNSSPSQPQVLTKPQLNHQQNHGSWSLLIAPLLVSLLTPDQLLWPRMLSQKVSREALFNWPVHTVALEKGSAGLDAAFLTMCWGEFFTSSLLWRTLLQGPIISWSYLCCFWPQACGLLPSAVLSHPLSKLLVKVQVCSPMPPAQKDIPSSFMKGFSPRALHVLQDCSTLTFSYDDTVIIWFIAFQ